MCNSVTNIIKFERSVLLLLIFGYSEIKFSFWPLTAIFRLGSFSSGISEDSQVQCDLRGSEGQVLCSVEDLLTLGKSIEHISLQHTSCLNGPRPDQYLKFNFTISLWAVCALQPSFYQPQIYGQTYYRWS